jgi:dTDP-4-dehydrorhamnose 3,5-epimerase
MSSRVHTTASPEQSAPAGLELRTPTTFRGPWEQAEGEAAAASEPLFMPVTPFADDRGWSLMNMLTGAMSDQGQVNFSMQYPGVVKAWHRHRLQTDFWVCLTGHLKIGVYRESDGVAWLLVTGERRPGALVIPPGLWHGAAAVGPTPAGLLYYVTQAYDQQHPDEQRRPFDSVSGFPWHTRHG